MTDPLELFNEWYEKARKLGSLKYPGAVCVSTVDPFGMPDGRFVDLKEVSSTGFIFTTHLDSPKSVALAGNANVALTFWWDHIERQIRVVGEATRISDARADRLFRDRAREAQLKSWASQQSVPIADPGEIPQRIENLRERFGDGAIPRPPKWGGYYVVPHRIEFLTFQETRLHERLLFYQENGRWQRQWLQP